MTFNFNVKTNEHTNYQVTEFDDIGKYIESIKRFYPISVKKGIDGNVCEDEWSLKNEGYWFKSEWEHYSTELKMIHIVFNLLIVDGKIIDIKSPHPDLSRTGNFIKSKVEQYRRNKKLESIL